MALPKLNTDIIHSTKLPILGKEIKYRPFFVKEEKILLMAIQGENEEDSSLKEMVDAIKNVIDNCTFGKLDLNKLSIIDLEWLMVKLRTKSKGEISSVKFKCKNNNSKGETCNTINSVDIDLTKVRLMKNENHISFIKLVDDIGVKMKYPTVEMIQILNDNVSLNDVAVGDELLVKCVDYVLDGEKIHKSLNTPKEELIDFFDTMTDKQFTMIKNFFNTMPKVVVDIKYKCKKCENERDVTLEGIKNFFG